MGLVEILMELRTSKETRQQLDEELLETVAGTVFTNYPKVRYVEVVFAPTGKFDKLILYDIYRCPLFYVYSDCFEALFGLDFSHFISDMKSFYPRKTYYANDERFKQS